jgi:hypothetical protein
MENAILTPTSYTHKDVQYWMPRALLRAYCQEQTVPVNFIIQIMRLHFFIRAVCAVAMSGKVSSLTRITAFHSQLGLIAIGLFLTLLGIALCNDLRQSTGVRYPTSVTRFSIYMTIAFTYIVFPLLGWTLSIEINNFCKTFTLQPPLIVAILLFTPSAIYLLILLLLRNDIPGYYLLSTVCQYTEIISQCVLTVVQLIYPFRPVANPIVLSLVICTGLGANVYIIIAKVDVLAS